MKLLAVRHGQTDYNKKHIVQGTIDTVLNAEGISQALNTKDILKNINIDICFTSPLKRALKTASIICDNKIEVKIDNRLKERFQGLIQGRENRNIDYSALWDFEADRALYEMELARDVKKRLLSFLDDLKEEYSDKTILVVTHHPILKALNYIITGENPNVFKVSNCEIVEYNL